MKNFTHACTFSKIIVIGLFSLIAQSHLWSMETSKIDPTNQDNHEKYAFTHLHIAVMHKDHKKMHALLEEGVININSTNGGLARRTALHLAVNRKDHTSARMLIAHNVNVTVPDIYGFAPLYYAALNQDKEMVEILLRENKSHAKACLEKIKSRFKNSSIKKVRNQHKAAFITIKDLLHMLKQESIQASKIEVLP